MGTFICIFIVFMISFQMKETKTASGGPDCPTLLHYLSRVIMRTDESLISFIDDLPNLEPAARG